MGIVFDSLKFYKLKNEKTARILFLIVYALFLAFYLFPIGKAVDVEAVLNSLMEGTSSGLPTLTADNILHFASQVLLLLVTAFFALVYANCHVMESEGFPNKKAVLSSIRSIPKLLGFVLLMLAPVAVSSVLFFIPLVYLFYALFFTPLLIMEGKRRIIESIIESHQTTKGLKLSIFVNQMLLYFIMNIPITLCETAFVYSGNENTIAEYLVMSFLQAAYLLMGGRLAANFYILAVKNKDTFQAIKIGIFKRPGESDETPDHQDEYGDENDNKNNDDTDNET